VTKNRAPEPGILGAAPALRVALRDPPQRSHRIALRRWFQQPAQVFQKGSTCLRQGWPAAAGPADHARQRRGVVQVLPPAADCAPRDSRRLRARGDPAIASRSGFDGGEQPTDPKPGVLLVEDMAIDRLLAKGVVFGGCNVALQVQSKMLASNAGVSADEAAKEWTANVIPGIALIPSGTWGVNRAQEAGCSYCAGG
jgi:hypothetical protein